MNDVGDSAKKLLAAPAGVGSSSKQLAERAARAFEELAKHLSRLLGETGVHMMLERSVSLASAQFEWLRGAEQSIELRHAMEQREPESIVKAFAVILTSFVDLLKRLIGDGLVDHLLNEVWPTVFVPEVKDTP